MATFRSKIFLAVFGVAGAGLLLASSLIAITLRRQSYDHIQHSLISEAKLAAELLSHRAAMLRVPDLQPEAVALGGEIGARVTLIAADGRVIADSSQSVAALASLENHGTRPEVIQARQHGLGVEARFSDTLKTNMLYVAVPVRHPSIAFVRLALPLTEIEQQLRSIGHVTLLALAVSTGGAFTLAWIASILLARRLNRVAAGARRYAAGDLAAPEPDYEDDEIGTMSRVFDDTARQLGERAAELARDRARMEAILAGMVEGVLVIDGHNRIQLVNAAARRMLRLDVAVAGRHYLEAIRHPGVVRQLDAALKGEEPQTLELALVREAGGVFVARAAPVSEGQGSGAVLVLHDITDLHRADQIRRDFVANVSHELRTPLTAIRGYVEALRDEPVNDEDRQKFLDIIARHAGRMERLVKDLLRLARLEAGQEPIELVECRTEVIFAGVVAELQSAIDARRLNVTTRVDPSAALINTDPAKLHDVLRNLVENALNYSPEGGLVGLEATTRNDHVVITVADQGPGIPPADLSRVFERFYRVDKARARDSGGTGLGLSIVKHVVERLEGAAYAENRQEGGAIFTVTLPIKAAEETPLRHQSALGSRVRHN